MSANEKLTPRHRVVEKRPGVCWVCGCTERTPCISRRGVPCSWSDVEHTLCTKCKIEGPREVPGEPGVFLNPAVWDPDPPHPPFSLRLHEDAEAVVVFFKDGSRYGWDHAAAEQATSALLEECVMEGLPEPAHARFYPAPSGLGFVYRIEQKGDDDALR